MKVWYFIAAISLACGAGVGTASYFVIFVPAHPQRQIASGHKNDTTAALNSVCAGMMQQGVHSGLCP